MNTLPLQLKLNRVLLTGKGSAAEAKYQLLTEMGAEVIWWQKDPGADVLDELTQQQQHPQSRLSLVVIAGFEPFDQHIADWAIKERMLLNKVDQPNDSNVFIPAIVKRGKLRIGIGTSGINPVLARLIRSRIELSLPPSLGALVSIAERWNKQVRGRLTNLQARRRFWEQTLSGELVESIAEGMNQQQQDELVETWLTKAQNTNSGQVMLVGAGPGDVGLISLKGLRALNQADVVLYDKLVDSQVLKLARRDALLEDVGKRSKNPQSVAQRDICARMVELAQQGKIVCRLKGGDPSLFARGGEEIATLKQAGIPFSVVPGITSANAAAAQLGISLTHRDHAHSLCIVTGHQAGQRKWLRRFKTMIELEETLVIYMGFLHLESITAKLIDAGVPAQTPFALVQNASLTNTKHSYTTLGEAGELVGKFSLNNGPILLIIGEVVRLAMTDFAQHDSCNSASRIIDRVANEWLIPT